MIPGSLTTTISSIRQAYPFVDSIAGFGDSFTEGTAATTVPNRYINIIASAIAGGNLLNQGIGGTVLQNSNGSGGTPLGNNGRDRFPVALLGANKRDGVIIAYGFNDARYTAAPATLNVAGYKSDLDQLIAGLLQGGYDRNKIAGITPWYITDTGLNTGTSGFSGQTRVGFVAFVTAALEIFTDYGIWVFDAYNYMLNNGGAAFIGPDNIHMVDFGHAGVAAGFLSTAAKINNNSPLVFTASRLSSTTADYSITAQAKPTTNYEIQYAIEGTFDYGNSVTVTALTGTVTIPSATSRIRARANFTDGTKSPWSFSSAIPSTTTFVYDTFTDVEGTLITAHTPEVGGAWSAQSGYVPSPNSAIATNRAYSQSNAGAYRNAATPPSSDYYVEAYIDVMSDLAGDVIGIGARYQSGAKTGYFVRFSKATANWRMFKEVAGATTQLGAALSSSGTPGPYLLRLTCQGSTITASMNGVDFATATDTAITAPGNALIMDLVPKTPTTGRQITTFSAVSL